MGRGRGRRGSSGIRRQLNFIFFSFAIVQNFFSKPSCFVFDVRRSKPIDLFNLRAFCNVFQALSDTSRNKHQTAPILDLCFPSPSLKHHVPVPFIISAFPFLSFPFLSFPFLSFPFLSPHFPFFIAFNRTFKVLAECSVSGWLIPRVRSYPATARRGKVSARSSLPCACSRKPRLLTDRSVAG